MEALLRETMKLRMMTKMINMIGDAFFDCKRSSLYFIGSVYSTYNYVSLLYQAEECWIPNFTISVFSFSPLFTFPLGEDRIEDIKFGRFIQGHFLPFQQPVQATRKKRKKTNPRKTGQKKQQTARFHLSFFLGRSWLL
jgi:hypothetical protein